MPGEMERLVPLLRPDLAILTNIGPVHLEFFRDESHILAEKGKLLQALPREGLGIINGDDPRLVDFARTLDCRVVFYGFERPNHVRAENVLSTDGAQTSFDVISPDCDREFTVQTSLLGKHNVHNCLAAITTALHSGLTPRQIKEQLTTFQPPLMRQEIVRLPGNILIINDAYNASPVSMRAALDLLASYPAKGRKVAILGDMLELGDHSHKFHSEIGSYLHRHPIDLLITVGKGGQLIANGVARNGGDKVDVLSFPHKEALAQALRTIVEPGDVILIKASRLLALETLVQKINRKPLIPDTISTARPSGAERQKGV